MSFGVSSNRASGVRALGRTVCAASLAGSLVACGVVVKQGLPALTVEVARLMMSQGGEITIEQAAKLTVTVLGPIALEALLAASTSGTGPGAGPSGGTVPVANRVAPAATQPVDNDWTIVVRRKVGGTVRNTGYRVAYAGKVYVLTNGRTAQSFEPSRKLITIDATSDTPTAVAVVDSLEQPVRSSGKFRLLVAGKYTDYDFDSDKRSASHAGTDLHAGLGGPSAAHGALYAKFSGDKTPSLQDCVTEPPDAWGGDFNKLNPFGHYCLQTADGRFGTLGISNTSEYSYTMWQTAAATK
ncbi:hypothetical protein [Embleya hyalina]|uniref:Uncharacterized protein n=1 Tax=Embleya hyalina TaxID=516124 RepID=A0A401YLY8_9ACTN|nr:hypothetical protein [Embleya hyalina]GCD95617.1 hypothetical protein EHYA_03292 [Embleya hyalina]